MLKDVGINVIANVIAALLGAGGLYATTQWILPLIRGWGRQLPRLNNTTWTSTTDAEGVTSRLTIWQSGTRITAKIEHMGRRQGRTFEYEGHISGHQIVLTWHDADSPEQLIGAYVMMLSQDRQSLTGKTVYYRHSEGKVVAIDHHYERQHTS